jgi:hypothetical protein
MTSTTPRILVWLVALLTVAACARTPESSPSTEPETTTAVPTTEPAGTTTTADSGPIDLTSVSEDVLEPGRYFVDHDANTATTLRAEFTIVGSGWVPLAGIYKTGPTGPSGYVAVKFLAVSQVASPACDSTVWVPVGDTAEDLAFALAGIGDFITQVAPTPGTAFGYDGYHLILEVPDLGNEVGDAFTACDDEYFDGYEGPTISRYYQGPNQVIEFWVLDVGGTPLVIETTWFPDSTPEDLAELQAILDSVVIRP